MMYLRWLQNPLFYCTHRILAATSSVLLGVYSSYTPLSSVLVSLKILCVRYETEFCNHLFVFATMSEKYLWTRHCRTKMHFYRLSESRIKRLIRHPARVEEGILEGAIACMQPSEGKNYSEIWSMYVVLKPQVKTQKPKIKIITAWRYPGKSPERDPVPPEVLREVKNLL